MVQAGLAAAPADRELLGGMGSGWKQGCRCGGMTGQRVQAGCHKELRGSDSHLLHCRLSHPRERLMQQGSEAC